MKIRGKMIKAKKMKSFDEILIFLFYKNDNYDK